MYVGCLALCCDWHIAGAQYTAGVKMMKVTIASEDGPDGGQ